MTDALGHFSIKSRTEQLVEQRFGEPVETLLRRFYGEQGLSQAEVASKLGVGTRTVIRWMAQFKIPTRDRRKVAA